MLFNKTASFQMEKLCVVISQSSNDKKIKINAWDMQSLLNGDKNKYLCLGSKYNIYYSHKNKHLRCDKNIINTYLTKGFDKKLHAYISSHTKTHEDEVDRLYVQWIETQERIIGGHYASQEIFLA